MIVNTPAPEFPGKMSDVEVLAVNMNDSWAANGSITLQYITQSSFDTKVGALGSKILERKTAGSARPEVTQSISQTDADIKTGSDAVKGYCVGKWGLNGYKAHLTQFGFVHREGNWEFPVEHEDRRLALAMMKNAVTANGFGAEPYGDTFWDATKTAFEAELGSARTIDQGVSLDVSEKDLQMAEVKKVLVSLYYVIVANYPDNWRGVLRSWGWNHQDF